MATNNLTTRKLSRADRARRLFEFGHVHPSGQRNRYLVDSDTPGKQYRVEFGRGDTVVCTCLDWQRQYERTKQLDSWCKHAQAVCLYRNAIRQSIRPHTAVA